MIFRRLGVQSWTMKDAMHFLESGEFIYSLKIGVGFTESNFSRKPILAKCNLCVILPCGAIVSLLKYRALRRNCAEIRDHMTRMGATLQWNSEDKV